jgi:polyisoprenoid-binding protein YceI
LSKLLLAAIALLVLAVGAVGAYVGITLLRDDDPELLTEAPAIPTAAAGTTPAASASAAATAASLPAGVLRFVVEPAQSSATYVVTEKLSRLPVESDAAGTTQDTADGDVTGELFLTQQGLASSNKSTFRVDLNTLKSDEGLRDNFVRQNTLRTNQAGNRYASFTIDSISGFPANYVDGQEVTLSLTGQMTINGQTKPVTFQVKARRGSGFLTATADATFNMSDFGITPPNVPTARAQDGVRLQVVLVARQAS